MEFSELCLTPGFSAKQYDISLGVEHTKQLLCLALTLKSSVSARDKLSLGIVSQRKMLPNLSKQ